MATPHERLYALLEYIGEQAKDIDPRAFRLAVTKGFLRERKDIVGLPGVTFDRKVEGDHVWVQVNRLLASKPIPPEERHRQFIKVSDNPDGKAPELDEA